MSARRRAFEGGFRWENVVLLEYKEAAEHHRGVSRQVLFPGGPGLGCQLRYFEVEPGGFTSLERHEHVHALMVLRGAGRALVGDEIVSLAPQDLLEVPAMTWHQLRACGDEPLGFLCLVDCERDRPQRPDEETMRALRAKPHIAAFLEGREGEDA